MRRPDSISGMLLHLARARIARSPGAFGLGLAALVGLGAVVLHTPCHAPLAHHRLAAPAGGACARTGALCVTDLTCGRGDRCVDTRDLRALVSHALPPGTRDDSLPLSPSLVWNGEGYGLVWSAFDEETAEIWFARASATGQRIGQPVRLTRSASLKVLPSLAASPEGYAVTWTDVSDDGVTAWILRLDKAGTPRGAASKVSAAGGYDIASRAVWSGRDYALAWYHVNSSSDLGLRFSRIAADGSRVGAESTVADKIIPTGLLDLRSTGDGYGVGWSVMTPRSETAYTLFARIGAGGEPSTPFRVATTKGQNGSVALAWTGRHFGFVWEDNVSLDDEETPLSRLVFAGVAPGSLAVPRRDLTPRDAYVTQAALAWTGSQYGLTYARLGGDGADVFFNRLDAQGVPARNPIRFTQGALGLFPSLAWSGTEFAVAWTHVGARGIQLRLARVNAEGKRVGDDVNIVGQ